MSQSVVTKKTPEDNKMFKSSTYIATRTKENPINILAVSQCEIDQIAYFQNHLSNHAEMNQFSKSVIMFVELRTTK